MSFFIHSRAYFDSINLPPPPPPPPMQVRFQHVLKGLPDTDAKLLAAYGATEDG